MHVGAYLELLRAREQQLAEALAAVADHYADAPDLAGPCDNLAAWSWQHVRVLGSLSARYPPEQEPAPPAPLPPPAEPQGGSYGLLHALHALWLLARDVQMRWEILGQVAWAMRDRELLATCEALGEEARRQAAWARTRLVESAAQAIIAAPRR